MELFRDANWNDFAKLIPEIKKEIQDWKVINIVLNDLGGATIDDAAQDVCNCLNLWKGSMFVYNAREMIALVQIQRSLPVGDFASVVGTRLPQYQCVVIEKSLTLEGIGRIEIVVSRLIQEQIQKNMNASFQQDPQIEAATWGAVATMTAQVAPMPDLNGQEYFYARKRRHSNVLMIVEDDMFARSMLAKAAGVYGRVIELTDVSEFVDAYFRELPDVVFMDLHLPSGQGHEYIAQVMHKDPTAFMVMVSADSQPENVLDAKAKGAKWFLVKPVTRARLAEAVAECKTLKALTR